MQQQALELQGIPAIVYGQPSDRVFLCLHGQGGNKEEVASFAALAARHGWQTLSIDLPEHGARRAETGRFDPWHVVPELHTVLDWVKPRWARRALLANSIGAWFSLLSFQNEQFDRCLLVSPVLDMPQLISDMMGWAGVTPEQLEREGAIETDFGQTLSWPYREYALAHPIVRCPGPTAILYAGHDHLTARETVDRFAERCGCTLTVWPDGEHWFHTPEQLDVLRRWLEAQLQLLP